MVELENENAAKPGGAFVTDGDVKLESTRILPQNGVDVNIPDITAIVGGGSTTTCIH